MSPFENARNINIANPIFIDIEGSSTAALGPHEILNRRVAWSALHNSSERYDPPRCHPKTRTAILNTIKEWTTGHREPILWLNGAAGAGKSAIAQTMAEHLQERGTLGASFFFRRDIFGLSTSEILVSTIAHQLHTFFPALRKHIFDAISYDPNIFMKSLKDQFNGLVINPLKAARQALPLILIIIDGLDECMVSPSGGFDEGEIQQRLILESLECICRIPEPLPIRFLISSRSEPQIRTCFRNTSLSEICFEISLKQDSDSESDVALFLHDKLAEIRQRCPSLDSSWPHKSLFLQIIENSSGHFMYPSTIIRHLLNPRVNSEQSLKEILQLTIEAKPAGHPLEALDTLYKQILESVAPESRFMVYDILQLLLDVGGGLKRSHSIMTNYAMHEFHSIESIAKMLSTTPSHIRTALVDLHSILDIPQTSSSASIKFIHASLHDFLMDRDRSGSLFMGGRLRLRLQISLLRYVDKVLWQSDVTGIIMFLAHILFCQEAQLLRHALYQAPNTDIHENARSRVQQLLWVKSAQISGPSLLGQTCELIWMLNLYEDFSSTSNQVLLIMKRNALLFRLHNWILVKIFRRPLRVFRRVDRTGLIFTTTAAWCLLQQSTVSFLLFSSFHFCFFPDRPIAQRLLMFEMISYSVTFIWFCIFFFLSLCTFFSDLVFPVDSNAF